MFDSLALLDPACEESARVERIAERERVKWRSGGLARAAGHWTRHAGPPSRAGVPGRAARTRVASEIAVPDELHCGVAASRIRQSAGARDAAHLADWRPGYTEWRGHPQRGERACWTSRTGAPWMRVVRRTGRLDGHWATRGRGGGQDDRLPARSTRGCRRAAKGRHPNAGDIARARTLTYLTALWPVAKVCRSTRRAREADICAAERSRGQ